jgi:hypothetical protein
LRGEGYLVKVLDFYKLKVQPIDVLFQIYIDQKNLFKPQQGLNWMNLLPYTGAALAKNVADAAWSKLITIIT